MCRPYVVYPSVDGHLDCFQRLALVNNAAVNMGLQKSEVLLSVLLDVC